jgi:hypothetical protein
MVNCAGVGVSVVDEEKKLLLLGSRVNDRPSAVLVMVRSQSVTVGPVSSTVTVPTTVSVPPSTLGLRLRLTT